MSRERELDQALVLMHFGFRVLIEYPDRVLARQGLNRLHHRILFFVRDESLCKVGRLPQVLRVSRQALNRPLRELIQRGFVVSAADPADRRSRILSLSGPGMRLEARLSGDQRNRFATIFARLGGAHEQLWRDVMQELAAPLWQAPAGSGRRGRARRSAGEIL
jgi:DNA-binding MarR family transcriptional regulator